MTEGKFGKYRRKRDEYFVECFVECLIEVTVEHKRVKE